MSQKLYSFYLIIQVFANIFKNRISADLLEGKRESQIIIKA